MKCTMSNNHIFHICTITSWQNQLDSRDYVHSSLETESFIHCSEIHQIEGVLSRYFQGQTDLLILFIDPEKLKSSVIYEKADIGESFPHIYGPVNKDAIVRVEEIH